MLFLRNTTSDENNPYEHVSYALSTQSIYLYVPLTNIPPNTTYITSHSYTHPLYKYDPKLKIKYDWTLKIGINNSTAIGIRRHAKGSGVCLSVGVLTARVTVCHVKGQAICRPHAHVGSHVGCPGALRFMFGSYVGCPVVFRSFKELCGIPWRPHIYVGNNVG